MPRRKIIPDRKMLKKVEELSARGVSKENIAYACGMCPATLYNRQNDDENFREAFKKGRARAEVAATNKLWELIEQGTPAAIIFYLKARCAWKEGQELDINADVTSTSLALDKMSVEQLMALASGDINEDAEGLDDEYAGGKPTVPKV